MNGQIQDFRKRGFKVTVIYRCDVFSPLDDIWGFPQDQGPPSPHGSAPGHDKYGTSKNRPVTCRLLQIKKKMNT